MSNTDRLTEALVKMYEPEIKRQLYGESPILDFMRKKEAWKEEVIQANLNWLEKTLLKIKIKPIKRLIYNQFMFIESRESTRAFKKNLQIAVKRYDGNYIKFL